MTTVLRSWLCRTWATVINSSSVSAVRATLSTKSCSHSCSTHFHRPPPIWITEPRLNRPPAAVLLLADVEFDASGGGDESRASVTAIVPAGTDSEDGQTGPDGGRGVGGCRCADHRG